MAEKSLRVMDTNKTFFSKITTTITKILIPTRVSINSMLISIKRNSLIKAYTNYMNALKTDDAKKENALKKYEESYALYLEAIDKYIMDSLYKKVKNNTASAFEREALSRYYLVVSLKEKKYMQYKYKKQEYLLKIDYGTISTTKNESLLEKYKSFYVSKIESLYKGLLKEYSVQIADTSKNNPEEIELAYKNIFELLESYSSDVLPIKLEKTEDNKNLEKEYARYEDCIIGKLDERDFLKKKAILIGISRLVFTHSLPLGAAEQCYNKVIQEARTMVVNSKNKNKRETALKILTEIIEEYSVKILSTKVYWDNPGEKEKYKKVWEQYKNINNENKKEQERQKVNLLLKYDLTVLNKNVKENKQIIKIIKEKLVEEGEMRQIKNKFVSLGSYHKVS